MYNNIHRVLVTEMSAPASLTTLVHVPRPSFDPGSTPSLIFVYHFLCAWLAATKFPATIQSTWFQSLLAQIARCVMMPISALAFSRGRWHSRPFFTLITLSTASLPPSAPAEESPGEVFDVRLMYLLETHTPRLLPTATTGPDPEAVPDASAARRSRRTLALVVPCPSRGGSGVHQRNLLRLCSVHRRCRPWPVCAHSDVESKFPPARASSAQNVHSADASVGHAVIGVQSFFLAVWLTDLFLEASTVSSSRYESFP